MRFGYVVGPWIGGDVAEKESSARYGSVYRAYNEKNFEEYVADKGFDEKKRRLYKDLELIRYESASDKGVEYNELFCFSHSTFVYLNIFRVPLQLSTEEAD